MVDMALGVANLFDAEYVEVIEEGIADRGGGGPAAAAVRIKTWAELTSWAAAKEAMSAMGIYPDEDDHWKAIGVQKEGGPSTEALEKRRRAAAAIVSAGVAHKWTEDDMVQGKQAMSSIQEALKKCHGDLPEITKRLRKQKAGRALVPMWQEPSTLLMEYAMTLHGSLSIALHLSNLQRIDIEEMSKTKAQKTGQPRVLREGDAKELCNRFAQSQSKIEEALRKFSGGGLVVWIPEGGDQIPRIMNAIQHIFTEESINVHVQFLVPLIPFPVCASADSLLDLWGHPLLHPKYGNMVKDICFIKETSRCVFTRDDSPVYAVKTVVSIAVQANTGGAIPRTLQLRDTLIAETQQGEYIYVDVPDGRAIEIRQALSNLSAAEANVPQEWRIERRSRGHTKTLPRYTIVGFTPRAAGLEVNAIIKKISSKFERGPTMAGGGVLVGRQSIFGDENAILAEASIDQLLLISGLLGECVLVNPHKALCVPLCSAEQCTQALTADARLHTVVLKYRRSGPLGGRVFARPRMLAEHVRTERYNTYLGRQPHAQASLLRLQAYVNVLNIDGRSHATLPATIIDKVGGLFNTSLNEVTDMDIELKGGEWRAVTRDGHWTGKILVQCTGGVDLAQLYQAMHGRGVCVDGNQYTVEVASPTNATISAQIFNELQNTASTAAVAAVPS